MSMTDKQGETKMSKTIKYIITIGLLIEHENVKKPVLANVCFAIQDDNKVVVSVDSARNGSLIKVIGKKIISRQELSDMPEDPYNDLVFARAAFELMNCTICGDSE